MATVRNRTSPSYGPHPRLDESRNRILREPPPFPGSARIREGTRQPTGRLRSPQPMGIRSSRRDRALPPEGPAASISSPLRFLPRCASSDSSASRLLSPQCGSAPLGDDVQAPIRSRLSSPDPTGRRSFPMSFATLELPKGSNGMPPVQVRQLRPLRYVSLAVFLMRRTPNTIPRRLPGLALVVRRADTENGRECRKRHPAHRLSTPFGSRTHLRRRPGDRRLLRSVARADRGGPVSLAAIAPGSVAAVPTLAIRGRYRTLPI